MFEKLLDKIPESPRYAVAYSGGADSTALLHGLIEVLPPERLLALHYEHGIRGEESLRDASHCEKVCRSLGVEIVVGHGNILERVKSGGNLEAEARRARYRFFQEVCREKSIGVILAAHHADDCAETLLMHLLRGAGLEGLSGLRDCVDYGEIFPELGDSRLILCRPLLDFSARELRDYCREQGLPFCTDATNADSKYSRNWLRQEIMPALMARCGQDLGKRLANASRLFQDAEEHFKKAARKFLEDSALICPFGILLDQRAFKNLDTALQRSVIRSLASREWGLDFRATENLRLCLAESQELPEIPSGGFFLAPDFLPQRALMHPLSGEPMEALKKFLKSRLTARAVQKRGEGLSDAFQGLKAWLKGEEALFRQYSGQGEFSVATFVPGQRVTPVNGPRRKVKEVFCEARLPRFLREAWPIVLDGQGETLWLPGLRISSCGAVKEGSSCFEISLSLPAARPWTKKAHEAYLKGDLQW